MKKIMIVLAIMGAAFTGTQAQAKQSCGVKKVAHHHHRKMHKTAVAGAHQVCTEQNGYYTCCLYKNKRTAMR